MPSVAPEGIRLQPTNPEMAPIDHDHGELEISGIVTGVMRTTQ